MSSQPDWLRLEEGESLVWTGQPRLRSILGTAAGALVTTVVVLAVVVGLLTTRTASFPDTLLVGVAVLAVVYGLARVGWAYLRVSNVDYVLTTTSLYKKTGVVSENTTRIRLDKIQNTTLSKDLFGNLFDYGDVGISTAGGSGIEMAITELDDPNELRDLLREQMRSAGGGGAARPAELDAETGERLVAAARELRETAQRLEEVTTE